MRAPALVIAVPLLAGVSAGLHLWNASPDVTPLTAAAGALIALLASTASFLDDAPAETTCCIVVGCALAGLSLALSAAERAYRPPALAWFETIDASQPVVVEGVLRDDAARTSYGASLTIDVREGTAAGGLRLAVIGGMTGAHIDRWRAGRRIRAPALLRLPSEYRNPGMRDELRALRRRGIALVGTVKSASLVEVIAGGTPLEERAAAIRAAVRRRLRQSIGRWSPQSSAIATAILIGDRSALSEEDERRLQEAGTYHVIAISGGNIAILTILAVVVLRAARVPPRPASALAITVLLFYAEIAGGSASVSRAITVAVIVLAGRLLDHRGPPFNALAAAAATGVAAAPLSIFDAGFILSFGATAGILIGARAPGSRLLAAMLAANVSAEIVLAPVVATVFSRVTFAGLLLNFAAIPLMTVVQVASLAVVPLAPFHAPLSSSIGYAAHLAALAMIESARFVDFAPWLAPDVSPPALWWIACYYGAAALLVVRHTRLPAIAGVVAGTLLLVAGPPIVARDSVPRPSSSHVRVVVLDVGQGDATLVQFPGGRALLVDAGGFPGAPPQVEGEAERSPGFDIGERVVVPALRALGVRRLDVLALTHGDSDHVQGAGAVLRRLGPRTVWEGAPVPPHVVLRGLAARTLARPGTWRNVQAGDVERWGGVEIRVLHPPPPDWERQRVRNEDSIVLEVRVGRVSIVLPGDIGREGEAAILPRLERGRLVVLKAPHHGSAGSSTPEFLRALEPSAVIFSAGRDNRFGHPHPSVIARYQAIDAEIFRTDRDGAVFVDSDGVTVDVWGWRGRTVRLQ